MKKSSKAKAFEGDSSVVRRKFAYYRSTSKPGKFLVCKTYINMTKGFVAPKLGACHFVIDVFDLTTTYLFCFIRGKSPQAVCAARRRMS